MNPKIFVAGHRGLVGSAIVRALKTNGFSNLVLKPRAELDLMDRRQVLSFFESERPDWVFMAAAKVGGIHANATYPYEFLFENLQIQNNIFDASRQNGVSKLLFLGSSCIYPKYATQPLKESDLLTGKLEPTNEAYALAKIAGIKMVSALHREYGLDYFSAMPCNLYGIGDNYHPQNAHVIPMLIRRFHEAKVRGATEVEVWGTGTPLREFLFADDLGEACVYLMKNKSAAEIGEFINIGTGKEFSIRELAELIQKTVGFQGALKFDPSKPDGTPRKVMDITRQTKLGWAPKTEFTEGLRLAYADFLTRENT